MNSKSRYVTAKRLTLPLFPTLARLVLTRYIVILNTLTPTTIAQYNSACHNTTLPFTGQNTIGSDTQFCSPDDGRKDARNMLRNN